MKIYNEKQECVGFLIAKEQNPLKFGIYLILKIRESLNLKAKEKFTIQAENPQEIELFGKEQIDMNFNIKEIQ